MAKAGAIRAPREVQAPAASESANGRDRCRRNSRDCEETGHLPSSCSQKDQAIHEPSFHYDQTRLNQAIEEVEEASGT